MPPASSKQVGTTPATTRATESLRLIVRQVDRYTPLSGPRADRSAGLVVGVHHITRDTATIVDLHPLAPSPLPNRLILLPIHHRTPRRHRSRLASTTRTASGRHKISQRTTQLLRVLAGQIDFVDLAVQPEADGLIRLRTTQ